MHCTRCVERRWEGSDVVAYPTSDLRPTFGLVQFSFGNTAPPYFLIASLISSLSRGRRYTGASDPDSDDSDSDSSSEPDSSDTDADLALRKTGRPRRSKGGSLSSSACTGCAGCAGARDDSVVRCGLRGMDEPPQDRLRTTGTSHDPFGSMEVF